MKFEALIEKNRISIEKKNKIGKGKRRRFNIALPEVAMSKKNLCGYGKDDFASIVRISYFLAFFLEGAFEA